MKREKLSDMYDQLLLTTLKEGDIEPPKITGQFVPYFNKTTETIGKCSPKIEEGDLFIVCNSTIKLIQVFNLLKTGVDRYQLIKDYAIIPSSDLKRQIDEITEEVSSEVSARVAASFATSARVAASFAASAPVAASTPVSAPVSASNPASLEKTFSVPPVSSVAFAPSEEALSVAPAPSESITILDYTEYYYAYNGIGKVIRNYMEGEKHFVDVKIKIGNHESNCNRVYKFNFNERYLFKNLNDIPNSLIVSKYGIDTDGEEWFIEDYDSEDQVGVRYYHAKNKTKRDRKGQIIYKDRPLRFWGLS